MELGIALPTAGPLASPAAIVRVAREAESLGYDAVWTFERLLRPIADMTHPDGRTGPLPDEYRVVYEPMETLSYVAAVTDRIRLGTSVVDALLHPPVVLARRFATLDQLSHGRAIAGLGQGWMPQEFETAGVPMSRLGAGMDDTVAALRACWGPDPVAYEGRDHRIAPSEINPKPVQAHLPIIMGAMTPAGIRRAARIADGFNPIAIDAETLRGMVAAFRTAATERGRDPSGLTVVVRVNGPLTREPMADRPYLSGSPAQIVEDLAALDGVDHVFFSTRGSADLDEAVGLMGELITQARV